MFDTFLFPSVTNGKPPEKQIEEIVNYLIQFKETLEFELNNISTDNLAPTFVNMLTDLGANIDKYKEEREEEVAQLKHNSLTISDVCNSDLFKLAVQSETSKYISFNINFDTGHLEYNVSSEEVN